MRALHARLGRRGVFLLLTGLLWVLVGAGSALTPCVSDGCFLPHEQLPVPLRVALWSLTGLVAIAHAFRNGARRDMWGFVALVAMPVERAFSLGYGFLLWVLPLDHPGYPAGLVGFAAWTVVTLAIVNIAGWPEPAVEGRS